MKIKIIDYGIEKIPTRSFSNDAGADVFATSTICIYPNTTRKIPLGFGLELPDGCAGFIFPRSSLALKRIVCEIPPIDSSYRGEIHAIIHNSSNDIYIINKNDRIGQLVILPVIISDFVTDIDLRGNNGFGSTGK